jgi:hypothetical protein
MEAQVEGRKQRGRQRITLESRIEEIGSRKGKTLAEMKKMARDREVWESWRKTPRHCNGTNGNGNGKGEEEDSASTWKVTLVGSCEHGSEFSVPIKER